MGAYAATRDQPRSCTSVVTAATTAASRMLEGWMSPYDGTVTRKVRQARMPILGKTNLDEFAMGSSNEHSAFGVVRNPWDLTRAPGGSGGGSAAAVASFQAPLARNQRNGGGKAQKTAPPSLQKSGRRNP